MESQDAVPPMLYQRAPEDLLIFAGAGMYLR